MFTRVNQPQSIGGVLDSGFKLFKASVRQVLPVTFIASIFSGMASWFLQSALIGQMQETGEAVIDWPLFGVYYVLTIVVTLTLMAAAILRMQAVYKREELSFGNALAAGVKRTPALFGTAVLYTIAVSLGFLLLVVPGIYLSVTLAFSFYAAAADQNGPIQGIKYSHSLVKGNWWRTAGLLTIVMFITMIFYAGIGFVMGVFVAAGTNVDEIIQPNILTDLIIVPALASVVAAILYCLVYVVYEDLKLRSEGTDLAERIENMA